MSDPEYAYIHIPKNAGLSMEKSIQKIDKIKYFNHDVIFENIKHLKKIYTIREPVDRFSSAFFYLKQYNKNIENNFFQTPDELLKAFLDLDVRAIQFMKVQEHWHTINATLIPTDWVFNKQIDWIFDPFKILIFENLEDEINRLNSELGVNIILHHTNKSEKTDFTYSQDSLDLLRLIYKKDFELYENVIRHN
jgi:hypothetical protein